MNMKEARIVKAFSQPFDKDPLPEDTKMRLEVLVFNDGNIGISKSKPSYMSEEESVIVALLAVRKLGDSLMEMLKVSQSEGKH